jgi:DNA-binding winged helix-turn-helix (wHTH) protein/tetratricopeptide (TPR) repeat protein
VAIPRDNVVIFGPFRLDARTESVWRDGAEIRLRPKSYATLRYLAERPERLVTKDELLEAVWPEIAVGDAALAVCIGEIRRALDDDARAPRFIETVHRRGYRFIGRVRAADGGHAAAADIVGRTDDLGRLHERLARALAGQRQVVFLTGAPGIGKTALADAFLATLGAQDLWAARGQCLDHYGAGEAYLPVLEALGRLARGPGGDRVVAALARHAPSWLVQMPGLVADADPATITARAAGATRERMLREMADAIDALAAERPVVLVLEDLHWSDHSTLDLVTAVARRRETARLLLVGTYRPADALARGHPSRAVTRQLELQGVGDELPLELLSESDVGRWLAARFGDTVGARLARLVHRRTDGLPLFVVNVVDAFVRRGLLARAGDTWEVRGDDAGLATAVPENLRQMIEEQLAALPADEQRVLEAASAAGVEFSAASLAAAIEEGVEAAEDRCETLARREQFLRAAGVEEWPDGTMAARYRFMHVLYQQVLYDRLPAARRASLHRRIGEREAEAWPTRSAERAGVLALHFERGGIAARAIRYRHQAAETALRRCAYREALDHLASGRALLERVSDAGERLTLELPLETTRGPALIALHGEGAPEVEAAYLRARELAAQLDDQRHLFLALWGLWYVNYGRARWASAREMGDALLKLAERDGDRGRRVQAHHALWATLCAMGASTEAVAHLERGFALYDPALDHGQAPLYGGHDAGACSLYHLALTRWLLGHPDRALATLRDALALAERLAHPMTTIIARLFAVAIHYLRGELSEALASARAALAVAEAQGALDHLQEIHVILASFRVEDRQGILDLQQRLSTAQAAGRSAWRDAMVLCFLAEVAARRGEADTGLRVLSAFPDEHLVGFFAPEVERVRGELLLVRGDRADAEAGFRRAIELARDRGQRSLELRAATSLARLLAGPPRRRDEARRLLGGVYGAFTEGFDTADLRAARSLLDELGGPP